MADDELKHVLGLEYREWMTKISAISKERDNRINELRRESISRANPESALDIWSRPVRLEALRNVVQSRLELRAEYARQEPQLLSEEALSSLRTSLERLVENAVKGDQRALPEAGAIIAALRVGIDKLALDRPAPARVEIDTSLQNTSRVFISYSWDSEAHKAWVLDLATNLRAEGGVDVILDRWHLRLGGRSPQFMEGAVRDSSSVLVICTPEYKLRFDNRVGGAGFEGHIITGAMIHEVGRNKFIPVLRQGDWDSALPTALTGTYGVDLRNDSSDEYAKLLDHLHGVCDIPAVGRRWGWLEASAVSADNPAVKRTAVVRDSDEFLAQRKRVPETDILKRIWSAPRWHIWIRPTEFRKARFQSLEHCREFIQSSYVRMQGSFAYPSISTDSLESGDEWIAGELDQSLRLERWALFRSGQFVHNRAFDNIRQLGDCTHVLEILDTVTGAIELATRMAQRGVLLPRAVITFDLYGIAGRRMTWPEEAIGQSNRTELGYWCEDEQITVDRITDPEELKARKREIALEIAVEIFSKFRWLDPPLERLAYEQLRRFDHLEQT